VRTVELVLDPELDATVREVWRRLHDAGLKSLATHRHPSNRPHLTLTTADELPPLPDFDLPLPATLDGIVYFERAVAWRVVPDERLRALLAGFPPIVPHVSLALRVPVPADYEPLLRGLPPATGRFVAARSYDTVTRVVSPLSPTPGSAP
jgi:hypothetical protein